jgi:RHS repeat-associated protein
VQAERENLAGLDREFQAEFQRVETTLRGAGLAPEALAQKLAAWTSFTGHYRARMTAALNALARDDVRSAQALLADSARTKPAHAVGASGVAPRRRLPVADTPATASPQDSTDLPTPSDLSGNHSVLLTGNVMSTAAAYGNSPAALYAFVHDVVLLEPYRLGMLNSESVLWAHVGNDMDQCTLLIALLRAAGIPARYVLGTMQMPYADVINWMGTKDLTNALALLGQMTVYTDLGNGMLNVQHTWVEAWIDSGSGPQWVPMAPGFKTRTIQQTGIAIAKPTFDRMKFLSSLNTQLASEAYIDQLLAALRQTQHGTGVSDLAYVTRFVPASPVTLPALPYPPQSVLGRFPDVPSVNEHSAVITLSSAANANTVYFTTQLGLPAISIDSVTVSFDAATTADEAVIRAFGGIESTPAAVANLMPHLRINDTISVTGTATVPSGTDLTLDVAVFLPGAATAAIDDAHDVTAGDSVAIGLTCAGADRSVLLSTRIDRLFSLISGNASSGSVTREFLNVAVLTYFDRIEAERESVANAAQLRFSKRRAEEAATIAGATVQKLFDRPFYLVPGPLLLDAKGMLTEFFDLNAPNTTSAVDQSLRYMIETTSSGLEGQLWQDLALEPSICTVTALQLASQAGQTLMTLTSASAAQQLAGSKIPQSTQQQMIAEAGNGATIITALGPVTDNSWSGVGWIFDLPSGKWGYMIQSLSGGATTGSQPPAPPTSDPGSTGDPSTTNGTLTGDPVSISNGNLFQQEIDFSITSRGPALLLSRTYNSLLAGSDSPFGFGWAHSYNPSLRDNGNSVAYVDANGGNYTFPAQGGSYGSPAGLDLTLTKDSSGFTMRDAHGTEWRFSLAGKLQTITDRNGNMVQLTYDSASRLMRVTDTLGRSLSFSYDGSNHITNVQDFAGRHTLYAYDGVGRLVSYTDPAGNKTTYAYAAGPVFPNGLTSVTTAAGKTTTYEYYENGQVATVIEAGGRKMHFFYHPMENETVYVDDRNKVTYYTYNSLGNVTGVVLPDGNLLSMTYSADAKLLTQTDEDGGVRTFTWDATGNMLSATDPLGNTVKYTYEPKYNLPASFTDAMSNVTHFQYDGQGNLIHTIYPLGRETHATYDSFGELLTFTDADGDTWTYAYDSSGNPISAADPLGNAVASQYDTLGRPTAMADALNNASRFRYDPLNRITATADGNGNTSSFTYDSVGNLAAMTDANGHTTSYGYDMLDQISVVTDALGKQTHFDTVPPWCLCTAYPNVNAYRDSVSGVLNFTYDDRNYLTQTVDQAGRTISWAYDARGNVAKKTDANGDSISFQYDAAGRLLTESYSDGTRTQFTYDANANMLSATNANSSLIFQYDALNRLISVKDSRFSGTLLQSYDPKGNRIGLIDPTGGSFSYAYDKAGRMVSIVNPAGAKVQITRDADGRPAAMSLSNGTKATMAYDAAGNLTALAWSSAAGAALPQFGLTYDAVGNPTSIAEATETHHYQYDAVNRLTAAVHPASAAESYGYDSTGNRTSSASDPGYVYDASERLTSAEGATYTWDANGNLIERRDIAHVINAPCTDSVTLKPPSKEHGSPCLSRPLGIYETRSRRGITTYTYDLDNHLVAIAFPDGTRAAYKYDAVGHRIEKNVNGAITRYFYDGDNVLLEFDGNNQFQARYTHGPNVDQPLVMERGGSVYFFHADVVGSIRSLTDATGRPVRSWTYDSFGRLSGFDPAAQPAAPYAFAGREYDAESGLYYLRARYYDPATGGFLSSDPLGVTSRLLAGGGGLFRSPQQMNSYSYAVNNPLSFRDPTGLRPIQGPMHPVEVDVVVSSLLSRPVMNVTVVSDFQHYLSVNNYRVSYTSGYYAGIISQEGTPRVIGYVPVSDLDFMGYHEVQDTPDLSVVDMLSMATSLLLQQTQQQVQASFSVPWEKLQGQEYWDAANDPMGYLEKHGVGSSQ